MLSATLMRRGLLAASAAAAFVEAARAQTGRLAIDILLEPSPAMLERAAADHARLRGNHPEGFALDSAHTPHITVLQAFVDAVDLPRMQAALIQAMAPFTRPGADAGAFDGLAPPAVLPQVVSYINGFVPERTGLNFNPHVTTGLGRADFVRAMVAEPFAAFEFGVTGAALFHLGIFGTANRRLWTWSPRPRG